MSFSIQWLSGRGVTASQGFRAQSARAEIKTEGDDLALILGSENSSAAAVFTTNQVKAAPVLVSAEHLSKNRARAIIVNAGNANCCTGARGLENARQMAVLAARKLGIAPEEVLVCSTGIIGHQLPLEKIETALQSLQFTKNERADEETSALETEIVAAESPGSELISVEDFTEADEEFIEGLSGDEENGDEISIDESLAIEESLLNAEIFSVESKQGDQEFRDEEIRADAISVDEAANPNQNNASESNDAENAAEVLVGADIDERVARAFMTTDIVPKFCAAQMEIGGKIVTVGGQAKGVGMIGPNMAPLTLHATLLAFLTTDAQIERELLQTLLERAVARSFNSVTVDGDMSTNDTAILLASGASGARITAQNAALFSGLLDGVCIELGKKIARDGEGATKLIEIIVQGARRESDAKVIALTIANSPLVKTAIFGKDPNWGRIAMAAGRAGIPFDAANLSFSLGQVEMFRLGEPVDFDLARAQAELEGEDVQIALDLGEGSASWTAWTCDFSYDYVKINAEYHT